MNQILGVSKKQELMSVLSGVLTILAATCRLLKCDQKRHYLINKIVDGLLFSVRRVPTQDWLSRPPPPLPPSEITPLSALQQFLSFPGAKGRLKLE